MPEVHTIGKSLRIEIFVHNEHGPDVHVHVFNPPPRKGSTPANHWKVYLDPACGITTKKPPFEVKWGKKPTGKQLNAIQEWMVIYEEEIRQEFQRALNGEMPNKIPPPEDH